MNPTRVASVVSSGLRALAICGVVCAGLLAAAACGVPVAPEASAAAARFELAAYDARGLQMPIDAVARRPEFQLSGTRALEPVELLLFAGEPDADLLEDLAALPLRAAHAARAIRSLASQKASVLRLAPRTALSPDQAYTLALPGSAKPRGGSALGDGAPAFVAAVRTLGSATAGAAWIGSIPAAGASGVPPNLAAAFVALDGAVEGVEDGVWVEAPDGTAVAASTHLLDCAELETRARTCVRLDLDGALQPGARYMVRSGGALRDAHGAPVEPLEAWFDTGSAADLTPPRFDRLACLPDEAETELGCLLVGDAWLELRLRADEPVQVAARSHQRQSGGGDANAGGEANSAGGANAGDPASAGNREPVAAQLAAAGEATLHLSDFVAGTPFELTLTAVDLAGNATEGRFESITAPPLATLSITEVLADPEGADGAAEYVEIANFGDAPVNLQGASLADPATTKPNLISSAAALASGARALLVTDDFDSSAAHGGDADAADPAAGAAIPPGAQLIRVGATLTKGGLANAGEQLFLRDADNHRLSAVPIRAAAAGQCLQRRSRDPRSGDPEDFTEAPCTPGR